MSDILKRTDFVIFIQRKHSELIGEQRRQSDGEKSYYRRKNGGYRDVYKFLSNVRPVELRRFGHRNIDVFHRTRINKAVYAEPHNYVENYRRAPFRRFFGEKLKFRRVGNVEPIAHYFRHYVVRHASVERCHDYFRKDIRHEQHNLKKFAHATLFVDIKRENKRERRNEKQIYRLENKRIFNHEPTVRAEQLTERVFEVIQLREFCHHSHAADDFIFFERQCERT